MARSASRTAKVLKEMGVEVEVFAWTRSLPPGELATELTGEDEIPVHRVGLFSNLDFSMQHLQNVIEWLHQERGFDAIWGHYLYPPGYMAVMQARLLGIKSTVSARGNDIDRIMFPPGDFARLSWTLEHADLISCVSRDLARKIDVLLGREVGVRVIGNSVDLETFKPGNVDEELKASLQLPETELILGFCGELRQKKGFPFLLQALCEVNEKRPATLLVIGEIRPREQETLAEFAVDHPEEARRIRSTGVIDEPERVAAHLQLCDVVLQPSVWDGLPNALLEAMACGRP
ncbi:MAG: glycosyltransferase, partial [Limisphaerales bacterium]